jgi:hypothetical protein
VITPWTGRGYLSVLYLAGTLVAFDVMVTLTLGELQFYRWPWLFGLGVVFAAVVNWIYGRRFNRRPLWFARIKDNPLKARNTFFFVAMDYWSLPVLGVGLTLVARGLLERY